MRVNSFTLLVLVPCNKEREQRFRNYREIDFFSYCLSCPLLNSRSHSCFYIVIKKEPAVDHYLIIIDERLINQYNIQQMHM
jgi:hypothetical protein